MVTLPTIITYWGGSPVYTTWGGPASGYPAYAPAAGLSDCLLTNSYPTYGDHGSQ